MESPIKRTIAGVVAVVVISLGTAACGSSSKSSSSTSAASTTAPASTSTVAPATTAPATTTSGPATTTSGSTSQSASPTSATTPTITAGPVHATLHGANHSPVTGRPWAYSVHVSDAAGHPLSGTVETEFVVPVIGVAGRETPPFHLLKDGVLNDHITFPADAVGEPITLVTVVHTSAGSVAVGWPVNVTK
jgi:hypothetical protein